MMRKGYRREAGSEGSAKQRCEPMDKNRIQGASAGRVLTNLEAWIRRRLRSSLAAVAERAQPLQRTAPSWRTQVQCSGRRRFTDGALAHVRTPGGPTSLAQPLFRLTRSSPTPRLRPSLTRSNRRGTDPYARWWGKGGIARCPPIPINTGNFIDSGLGGMSRVAKTSIRSVTYGSIPYASEQGIFCALAGN